MSTPHRRNLVIVRAGENSLHTGWICGPDRDFDLFISYFGNQPDRYLQDAEYHENRKGMKWPVLGEILAQRPELIERYDSFWFPDDDIIASTDAINRMFDFFRAYRMSLAQPALTRDSYYTWPLVLQHPSYELRFTRFVEVMAPLFDRTALKACQTTFAESTSGWGLDFLWPRICGGGRPDAIGIIDAVAVKHSRPVGGGELYKDRQTSVANEDERQLFARFGVSYKYKAEARYFSGGVRRTSPFWLLRLWLQVSKSIRKLNYVRRERRQSGRSEKAIVAFRK